MSDSEHGTEDEYLIAYRKNAKQVFKTFVAIFISGMCILVLFVIICSIIYLIFSMISEYL